jgi:hypothetical protein
MKTALAVIIVCFSVRENFPFSHFPMYSSFSDYSYYIYFTDSKGEPIPIETLTSHKTSSLKKIYDKEIKKTRKELQAKGEKIEGFRFMTTEQRKPAGELVLDWIYNNTKETALPALNEKRPLRVYQVDLFTKDGEITSIPNLIAEAP